MEKITNMANFKIKFKE